MIEHTEAPETYQARKVLRKMFEGMNFVVEEEVKLDTVTNNMEEEIWPPYQADMIATKQFIVELDTETSAKGKAKGHGTRKRRIHDQWRDKNIKNQMDLKTVRLHPDDILRQSKDEIMDEINHQLRFSNWQEEKGQE